MLDKTPYRIVPLEESQLGAAFECLDPALTAYFTEGRIWREREARVSAPYVLLGATEAVLGFYTLSATTLNVAAMGLSKTQAKKFPYPTVPATLLGRLALHSSLKGRKMGAPFIQHALNKALEASYTVASYAVVVHAKNDRLAEMYVNLGFIPFADPPLHLFLPMKTLEQLALVEL